MKKLILTIRPCKIAETDHAKSLRQYAHTLHVPNAICVCKAAYDLPDKHWYGLLAHEIGHVWAQDIIGTSHTEKDADETFREFTKIRITYKDGKYGKNLQTLSAAMQLRMWLYFTTDEFLVEAK